MNRCRKLCAALFIIALALATNSVQANDAVDNPKYVVWSQFKEGSSSTVSADIRQAGKNTRIDVTKTLTSFTAEQAVIETVVSTNGKPAPATSETILAKTTSDAVKITGNRKMLAMGKTFDCKVWDVTSEKPDQKHSGTAPVANGGQAIICISPDVPGGVVELESLAPDGQKLTFVLTAMEAK